MLKLKNWLPVAAAVLLVGCATGANRENMVHAPATVAQYPQGLQSAITSPRVDGGKGTNPLWMSNISNESFAGALRDSLAAAGLLGDAGRYSLQVQLVRVQQPLAGFDMTVTTHIRYVLTDTHDGATVFDDLVVAPYTASVGDAFVGTTRLRMANEGSGQRNIAGFMEKLAGLEIAPASVSLESPAH